MSDAPRTTDIEGRTLDQPDDKEGVESALIEYARAKTVPVYFSEKNPVDAVLDHDQPGATFFRLIFPAAAAACWVWYMVSVTRSKQG